MDLALLDAGASKPLENELAKLWDAEPKIRERLRFNGGRLLAWPLNKQGKELVGVPTVAALAMNSHVMTLMASWWCPTQSVAKTPGIPVIKKEARAWGSNHSYHSFL